MEILNMTSLRRWAKDNGLKGEWWYSVNGKPAEGPTAIAKVPRTGKVIVMHAAAKGTEKEKWFWYRYPGYESPEEYKARTEPTEKQKVALEFFGKRHVGLTKDQASELLDKLFDRDPDYVKYREHKWKNRYRMWKGKELLTEKFRRMQSVTGEVSERVAEDKKWKLVEEGSAAGLNDVEFEQHLRKNHPGIFVSETTRKRKVRERARLSEWMEDHRTNDQKRGCVGLVVALLVPATVLVVVWVALA